MRIVEKKRKFPEFAAECSSVRESVLGKIDTIDELEFLVAIMDYYNYDGFLYMGNYAVVPTLEVWHY